MPGNAPMRDIPFWLRSKRRLLAVFWLVQGIVLYVLVSPLSWPWADSNRNEWLPSVAPFLLVFVFTLLQGLFMLPVYRPGAGRRGTSVIVSLTVAGLLIVLLLSAAVAAVAQVFDPKSDSWTDWFFGWRGLAMFVGAWLIVTPLLIAFSRPGRRDTALQRLAARLFLGTMVEAAAIIPLDVLVRRRGDCICATGTYLGLTLCATIGLIVLGPLVFLPLLVRRRRRWYHGRCEVCGYDMTATPAADRCPECGAGWRVKPLPEPGAAPG